MRRNRDKRHEASSASCNLLLVRGDGYHNRRCQPYSGEARMSRAEKLAIRRLNFHERFDALIGFMLGVTLVLVLVR